MEASITLHALKRDAYFKFQENSKNFFAFFYQVFDINISIRLFLSFLIRSLDPPLTYPHPFSPSISCLSVSLLSSCPSRSALSNHHLGSFRCLQLLLPPPPLPYTDAIVPSSVLRFIRFHSSTLSPVGPYHLHLCTVYLHSIPDLA